MLNRCNAKVTLLFVPFHDETAERIVVKFGKEIGYILGEGHMLYFVLKIILKGVTGVEITINNHSRIIRDKRQQRGDAAGKSS